MRDDDKDKELMADELPDPPRPLTITRNPLEVPPDEGNADAELKKVKHDE